MNISTNRIFLFCLCLCVSVCVCVWLQVFTHEAHAAAFETLNVGARPTGMGGAYVAVADDGLAAFYNPAGLTSLKRRRVESSYTDHFNLGLINRNFLAYAQPKIGRGAMAVSMNNLSTSQKVRFIDYSENTFGFSFAYPVWRGLSAGATLKYFWVNYDKRATGYGYDLALLLRLAGDYKFGILMRNANHPNIRWQTQATDRLPTEWEIGVSGSIGRHGIVSFQWDRSSESRENSLLKFGGEFWVNDRRAATRAGIRGGLILDSNQDWIYTAGMSVVIKALEFSYGVRFHFDLDAEHTFSLNFGF